MTLVAAVCACLVVGALLFALPDYFRYVAAIRFSPPLPEKVEEAFERAYQDLAEMRQILIDVTGELSREKGENVAKDPGGEWVGQMEEELSRLRLDLDAIGDKLGSILPEDSSGGKPLPEGMLAKALSQSGKGSKLPTGEPFKTKE